MVSRLCLKRGSNDSTLYEVMQVTIYNGIGAVLSLAVWLDQDGNGLVCAFQVTRVLNSDLVV